MSDAFQRFGPYLAALGIGAGGTTGVVAGLDPMGIETKNERIQYLESQVSEEKFECQETIEMVTEQCREEIRWLRERIEP